MEEVQAAQKRGRASTTGSVQKSSVDVALEDMDSWRTWWWLMVGVNDLGGLFQP